VTLPGFDPSRLLAAAETAILGRTEAAPNGSNETRKASSWVSSVIIVLVVIGGMVVYAWVRRRHSRELAKLRHERNVASIEATNATTKQAVEENIEVVNELKKDRAAAIDALRVIDADIRAEKGRYDADMLAIDRILSWSDL